MKGKILTFDNGKGIILGEDEQRYEFDLNEWKENISPQKGLEVDFEAEENMAKNIYSITPLQNTTLNIIPSNINVLGGLGSVFILFGWIPYVGLILYIAGFIMLSIALKKLSDISPEKGIFRKWIISLILAFGIGILFFIAAGAVVGLSDPNHQDVAVGSVVIFGGLTYIILQIVIGILYKQIFHGVYEITGEKLFKTAGTTFFWGGILSIILIGAILFFIGWIIVAIAFFSLKREG